MRLLADENFPYPTVARLRADGHDVLWARTDCPGVKDKPILARAAAEDRVLLTLDKDFWQLAVQRRPPIRCGVILFRVHPAIPARLTPLARRTLAARVDWAGHLAVVTESHVRMIPVGR